MNEQQIQESQYVFPYHYLPLRDPNGSVSRVRGLKWGYEYLAYSEFILSKVVSFLPKRVLEVGCGDGYIANKIAESEISVTGVDISSKAIGFAKAFSNGAQFFDEVKDRAQFDMVVLIEVLEHIPDEKVTEFISFLLGCVEPNGHLVVSVPSKVVPVHKKHFRHYDLKMLMESFSKFESVELIESHFVYQEPAWFTWFLRLTFNKYFIFEPIFLSKWIWKYVVSKMLQADSSNGRHLVCVFKKKE